MARETMKSAYAGLAFTGFHRGLNYEAAYEFEDWAERFMSNPDGGRFRLRPYQRLPARSIFNPRIRNNSLRAYSGAGKTVLAVAAFAYGIDELGIKMGLMYPSDDSARDRLRDKFWPYLENTPRIMAIPMRKGNRGAINMAADKQWVNGARLQAIGANSPGKIRVLECQLTYADEIDAIDHKATDEGDKCSQLAKRTRGESQQFHLWTSYPSRKAFSKIDEFFEKSDQCRWLVPCYHCRVPFEMHTRQIEHPPGKPERARILCPACGRGIDDAQRYEISNDGGTFVDRWGNDLADYAGHDLPEQFQGERGFHIGCLSHVGEHSEAYDGYLHEVAYELEQIPKAENPERVRRVFVNTMDAESYQEEQLEKPEIHTLYGRREPYDPYRELPAGVLVLRAGVDVQKDRLEVEVVGFGDNEEEWGCGYRVIQGSPLKSSTWNKLFKYLARDRPHPGGRRLPVSGTCVDTAYRPDEVFKAIRHRSRVWGVKGGLTLGAPIISRSPAKVGRPPSLQWTVGTHEAKDQIYQRAQLVKAAKASEFPRGAMHWPDDEEYGEETGGRATGYFEMMFAEDAVEKKAPNGEWLPFFECPKGRRNEALDCRVYAKAALRKNPPNWAKLKKWVWDQSENDDE